MKLEDIGKQELKESITALLEYENAIGRQSGMSMPIKDIDSRQQLQETCKKADTMRLSLGLDTAHIGKMRDLGMEISHLAKGDDSKGESARYKGLFGWGARERLTRERRAMHDLAAHENKIGRLIASPQTKRSRSNLQQLLNICNKADGERNFLGLETAHNGECMDLNEEINERLAIEANMVFEEGVGTKAKSALVLEKLTALGERAYSGRSKERQDLRESIRALAELEHEIGLIIGSKKSDIGFLGRLRKFCKKADDIRLSLGLEIIHGDMVLELDKKIKDKRIEQRQMSSTDKN